MSLEIKIGSRNFRNPIFLASGVLGTTYSTLHRVYNAGLGAVVTKSIGPNPREGNPNPSVFALHEIKSVINSVGLANPGYKVFSQEIKELIELKVNTIVSIFGSNISEFLEVIKGIDHLPFTAYELNLSCPNTEKEGMALGTDPNVVYDIVSTVRKNTEKPIYVKLTPNVTDIIEIAAKAVKAKCDALVAINTLKAMVIDIYTKTPILGYKKGGLSGAAIKPIGVRYVYDLYEQFGDKMPIVGVGGITKWQDIIEYMLAGATAVEIGTALGVAHPENKIKFFIKKIESFVKSEGYNSIKDITGGAHK
ncbi:MAG: dihydroorotate dehydrogenase [Candidatus Heimdallarchaeaceae archaeon]